MKFPISNFRFQILILALVVGENSVRSIADERRAVSETEALPFGQRPVDYWGKESHDPVAGLQRRIAAKEVELPFIEQFGYLPAILKELDIPVESQLLTFSSQSPHRHVIRPERPRAVYFNDDVSVSWYPGAVLLEIASHDSQKGTLFYTLVNRQDADLEFYRSGSQTCLGCHHAPGAASATGVAVPGHLVKSFLMVKGERPEGRGKGEDEVRFPLASPLSSLAHCRSHALPIEQRWQTWYVTGVSPEQRHLGNLSQTAHQRMKDDDPTYHRVVFDLATDFDTSRYPADTSDIVAHLVFDHQMLGMNLLSRLSYEHQFQVRSKIESMVIRYLLLVDEAPLNKPVLDKSPYAEWYRARGPKNAEGRSLYELDLETRLFRHRISPLVNSRMVQGFPPELKRSLFQRLNAVLTGMETLDGVSIPEADRQSALAVLRATVQDWPAE